jgi:hypothetical protein
MSAVCDVCPRLPPRPPFVPRPTQRRVRSWALGSRRRLAAPVVWDGGCERYFAALLPPGGKSGDATLVAFTDELSSTLDALPVAATLRDGVYALLAATPPPAEPVPKSRMAVDAVAGRGGVLVVSAAGGVSWVAGDGSVRASCPAPDGAARAQAAAAGAEADARGVLTQCVAVVSAVRAQGSADATHRLDVYAAAATAGTLTHSAAATLTPPAGAPRASVVAVTCTGRGAAAVLWSDGSWEALAGSAVGAPAALAPLHSRRLACFAMSDGAAALAAATPGGKKRRGGAEEPASAAPIGVSSASLSRVGAAAFGGAYAALLGPDAGGKGVMLTVLDVSYGAVHAATVLDAAGSGDATTAASSEGRRMQCVALPSGRDAGRARIAFVAPSGGVMLAHVAFPPLSLAAAVGALASPAAACALDKEALALQLQAPHGATVPPVWRGKKNKAAPAAAAAAASGAPAGVSNAITARVALDAVWDTDAMLSRDAEHAALATRLLDAGALRTAGAVTSALLPLFASAPDGSACTPPARVVDAALLRCIRDGLWQPLGLLLEGGHAQQSAACPDLVAALLQAQQLRLLRLYVSHAAEVGAADLADALAAALAIAVTPADSLSAAARESLEALRAEASAAVDAAEEALRSSPPDAGAAALGVAHLRVSAVEEFAPGEAALLHAVVASRRDDGAAIEAIRTLSPEQVVALLEYLHRWLRLYHARLWRGGGAAVLGLPCLEQVVSWASLVLDGHFLRLAARADSAAVAHKMHAAIKAHVTTVARLAPLEGPLAHLCAAKPLPSPAGTVSAHYSVEMLHL